MTTIYIRHDVTTIAEVNALALTDNQENGAFVLGPNGEDCSWFLPYAVRNEQPGRWSYEDGYGGSSLIDGDKVTVLVPVEAEEQYAAATDGARFPARTRAEAESCARGLAGGRILARLVTPWEPA